MRCGAVRKYFFKLDFVDLLAIWCEIQRAASGRRRLCGPYVVVDCRISLEYLPKDVEDAQQQGVITRAVEEGLIFPSYFSTVGDVSVLYFYNKLA